MAAHNKTSTSFIKERKGEEKTHFENVLENRQIIFWGKILNTTKMSKSWYLENWQNDARVSWCCNCVNFISLWLDEQGKKVPVEILRHYFSRFLPKRERIPPWSLWNLSKDISWHFCWSWLLLLWQFSWYGKISEKK